MATVELISYQSGFYHHLSRYKKVFLVSAFVALLRRFCEEYLIAEIPFRSNTIVGSF